MTNDDKTEEKDLEFPQHSKEFLESKPGFLGLTNREILQWERDWDSSHGFSPWD